MEAFSGRNLDVKKLFNEFLYGKTEFCERSSNAKCSNKFDINQMFFYLI